MEQLNFDNYPPKYKAAAEKLILDLSKMQTFSEKKEIFENFCRHFSVVPNLWKAWVAIAHDALCKTFVVTNENYTDCIKMLEKLYIESRKHFYVDPNIFERYHFGFCNRPYRKLLTFPDFDRLCRRINVFRLPHVVLLEQILIIPHSKLNDILELYKNYCDAPLNTELLKQHENAKELYRKIMAANTDTEWLNLLLEVKDDEFIVDNIEDRISENPCSSEVWAFYLDHFEKLKDIKILEIYRRYCRVFIEDTKTREKYIKKIEYFKGRGHDVIYWIDDLIKFFENFGIHDQSIQNLSPDDASPRRLPPLQTFKLEKRIFPDFYNTEFFEHEIRKKCKLFFNSNFIFQQEYSLPKTLMFHLTKKYSVNVYRKLIQTCKTFFWKKKVIPIWHMNVTWHVEDHFHRQSIYLSHIDAAIKYSKQRKPAISFNYDVWLEHSVRVYAEFKFLNKIYQSDLQYLHLYTDITLKDYDMLVKSGRIREICLGFPMNITETEADKVTLERLMKWLPNAYKITLVLKSMLINVASSEALAQLKRNVKLREFSVSIRGIFESNAFCQFLKDNLAPKSLFSIYHFGHIDENNQSLIKTEIKEMIAFYQDHEIPEVKMDFYERV